MEIFIVGGGYIAPGRERLRAYIESSLEWMAESRAQIVALLAIFNAVPYSAGGQPAAYADRYQIVIPGSRTICARASAPQSCARSRRGWRP